MAITPILTTAASGLLASARRAQAAADSIVNVNTPGATSARVATTSVVAGPAHAAGGGSGVQAQLAAGAAAPELAGSLVELLRAEAAFKASAAAFRTGEELARESVDLIA